MQQVKTRAAHRNVAGPADNLACVPLCAMHIFGATQDLKVNGAGYLPFGDGCDSDHRLIWADFSFHSAFGQDEIKPPRISIRKLKADDPRLVKRYNRKVKAALVKEGLIQKAFALQVQAGKHGRRTKCSNQKRD